MTKTGECYYRDEDGSLWLAVSYVDEKNFVTTQDVLIEQNSSNSNQLADD
jgi:hypothetical protein